MPERSAISQLQQKPFDDTFGNYLLHGMQEIYLPDDVAWWPQTLAWKLLAVFLLAGFCLLVYRVLQRWQANAYRRDALKQLSLVEQQSADDASILSKIPVLLKATALQVSARTEIAKLSGEKWLHMLNQSQATPFSPEVAANLIALAYQAPADWQLDDDKRANLFAQCKRWVKTHDASQLVQSD